jgi:RNA polymerase sigma-70 factor (ECF subfamily)
VYEYIDEFGIRRSNSKSAAKDPRPACQSPGVQHLVPGTPSFRAVFEAELGYVCRVLVRFGVPPKDLDDLAQDVFLVVHRRRLDYDPRRPIRPWLCGIAFRVASDWRRRAHHRELGDADIDAFATEPISDRHVEAQQLVVRALSRLSFDQRAVVVLCDLEGHTAGEAAAHLGVPTGTVYSRLHEARRLFVQAVQALEEGT